jgi:hypothetical protein
MSHDEMIAVIQAHKAGKQIEIQYHGCSPETWALCGDDPFTFNFTQLDFRVKPEPPKPRDFWICYTADPTHSGSYIYGVKQNEPLHDSRKQIHVREVLPEEEG